MGLSRLDSVENADRLVAHPTLLDDQPSRVVFPQVMLKTIAGIGLIV